VTIALETLVVRMAEENASWGYRRIQGALAHVGYHIDKITMRNILRHHHIDPAPQRHQTGMSWVQFVTIHWAVLTATGFFTEGIKPLAEMQMAAMQLGQALVTSCL
jgi:putative transposase